MSNVLFENEWRTLKWANKEEQCSSFITTRHNKLSWLSCLLWYTNAMSREKYFQTTIWYDSLTRLIRFFAGYLTQGMAFISYWGEYNSVVRFSLKVRKVPLRSYFFFQMTIIFRFLFVCHIIPLEMSRYYLASFIYILLYDLQRFQ